MIRRAFMPVVLLLSMQGCFTGIESTKPISKADVKKERIEATAEQKFLADIAPEPMSAWEPGKKLHVTDRRIALVLTGIGETDDISGSDIEFVSVAPVPSINGADVAVFNFTASDGSLLSYKSNYDYSTLGDREAVEVPFTVELSVVDSIRSRMAGRRYYITTPLWYDATGARTVPGLRHVPVDIVDVVPGDAVYPVRVIFDYSGDSADKKGRYSVYMTVGNGRAATRNFDTLLSFTDPRSKYPNISPDVWQLIVNSQVREGMTKTECRLALGQPTSAGERPTTAGMVEYWSYSDGVYLLFEDGYLTMYRR